MALVKTWTFESSSNPNKVYETQLHDDGSTSCNCPGWTKRAVRTCKHTRMVEQGIADRYAVSVWEQSVARQAVVERTRAAEQVVERQQDKNTKKLERIRDQLAKEKKEKMEAAAPIRKVNWHRTPA